MFQNWGRRFYGSYMSYIESFMNKLNPDEDTYIFMGNGFELYCKADFATEFKNKQFTIRSLDVHWMTTEDVFDNS